MRSEEIADYHFWRANELAIDDRNVEAVDHLISALEAEPRHIMSLVLLGDLYLFDGEEFGLSPGNSCAMALSYYETALSYEWKHADPWSGKALALSYMDRPEEALEAAENGLYVLPLCIGYTMEYPPVHINIAQTLFKVKVYALLDLGREVEARIGLSDGLAYCPGSNCLTQIIYDVLPESLRVLGNTW